MKNYKMIKCGNETVKDCDMEESSFTDDEDLKYPYISNLGSRYNYYLHGEIKSSEYYIPLFNMLSHAEENDLIQININSQGGDLTTGLAIRDAICLSNAHVNIFVQGLCASSATVVMLSFNGNTDIMLAPNCEVMVHSYSSGMYGKGNELTSAMDFREKWFNQVLHDVYGGFLTEKEINSVIDGKDYYFTAEETRKRIGNKLDFLNKKRK